MTLCTGGTVTLYSSCVLGYSNCVFWLCTGGTVYSSCVLGYSDCILAVYWGYMTIFFVWWSSECVLWLCTGGTVTVYSGSLMVVQ